MEMKRVLQFMLVIAGICFGTYEVAALATPAEGDTISEVVWEYSKQYPIIPLLFGIVAGHLFWQKRKP